jgi:hypothetical protein
MCTAEPCTRRASCVGLLAGSRMTGSPCTHSRALCCSKPWPRREALACMWPSIPHPCGIPTVWCACSSSLGAEPCRWGGKASRLPGAVWPMPSPKMCWRGWLRCFPSRVPSSGRRSVGSPTRSSWPISRGWGGTGAFASTGVVGLIALGSGAAKCSACRWRQGRPSAGTRSTVRRSEMVLSIGPWRGALMATHSGWWSVMNRQL